MGDTEGRTQRQGRKESREEGETDSPPTFRPALPVPLLSLPHPGVPPHLPMLERGSKLCSHLAPLGRKEELEMGGCLTYSGQGQTGSCMKTGRHHRKHTRKGV